MQKIKRFLDAGAPTLARLLSLFSKSLYSFLKFLAMSPIELTALLRRGGKRVYRTIRALIRGHWITLKYFPKEKVTIQYPFSRRPLTPYYRGRHYLIVEEDTGRIRCDACTLCARICPTSVIDVWGIGKGEEKRPAKYTLNLIACLFCGLCVDICPEDAIKMVREFELSQPHRPDAYAHSGDLPNVLDLSNMLIFASALYPDGRYRDKHLEEEALKKAEKEKKEAQVAQGKE
ncbi:MAG: NuoI/complex I 23 kDa subunit family protein [bacterium JZ-2024 1]